MTPDTLIANRYRVIGTLGRGGIGTALRVRDRVFDADVALKLVPGSAHGDLRREFLALRASQHPHIVRVHDFGLWRGGDEIHAFYTCQIVSGTDLQAFAKGRRFEAVRGVLGGVLAALASLHARGILHGDVKPENILVTGEGNAVLIDLSCSRTLEDGASTTDTISGTPGFMAPELARGIVDRTADLFAFGRTLGVLDRALDGGLPSEIAVVAERLTRERPEQRPQSAAEAAELLRFPPIVLHASDQLGTLLVARGEELRRFRELLDRVTRRTTGPRVVLVVGDEGSGRTRLLEEAKVIAQERLDAVLVDGSRPRALATMLTIALGENNLGPAGAALTLAERAEPTVLFIDDADELDADERARLFTLLRAVPSDGNLAIVVASRESLADHVKSVGASELVLAPLAATDVKAWLRAEIPDAALDTIVRLTRGYPKEIAAVLAELDAGAWGSRTLERALYHVARGAKVIDLGTLSDDGRALLARIVASGALRPTRADRGAAELFARQLAVELPDGLHLARPSRAPAYESALGREAMRAAHAELARAAEVALEKSEPAEAPNLYVSLIAHLAATDPDRAERALHDAPRAISAVSLRPAADALSAVDRAHARCAEIYADAGEPGRALSLVARALARRPAIEERISLREIAGRAYALMGDSRRAVLVLRRLLPSVKGTARHAPVAAALSLALLKRGADQEAVDVVNDALASVDPLASADASTRLDLTLNAAFAMSRLAKPAEARSFIAVARAAADAHAPSPRGRFRLASAAAFVEYGAGETTRAMQAYGEALELAEKNGLDDLVASAALNYGTACHERGDLGAALDAYARGQRLARALGMPTTEVTLAFDIAKAYADIGSYDRAAELAPKTRDRARAEGMTLLEAGAEAILAEAASAAGDVARALVHLDHADRLLAGTGDRDSLALAVQRAKTQLAARDARAAETVLANVAAAARAIGRDSEASWLGARAAVAIANGETAAAIQDLERALPLAEASGQRGLIAEIEARLADAYALAGTTFLAYRHRSRARELWEMTLATLPPELKVAFRGHPARRSTFADAPVAKGASASEIDVRRILEINRRLVSATTTNAVLEETMDAAISLTHAERGFLLVQTRGKRADSSETLRVAVARNIDRENLRQGHLKFSRTVAERVVRTGEPVVAVDAAFDPRFAKARSVHAMRLKSVLCVPIRTPDGVLGAIYVDHRFSPGGFSTELIDVLFALADQAALALVKARLLEELRQKTQELEERNAEIERLARGQALEIARLKRAQEPATDERRFDYRGLIATSAPMRRVLGVLDRVIDADVTVLVRGESGTGKERVARAIHANSGRSAGPFVAINCGALPETLLEAELFGYRKGAFSGATRDQPGLFVAARSGTLFLDELGEMPPSMQVKLLRVLQEREVRPLGTNETIAIDVRLVCATNRVLSEEVRAGRFREDLYYRVAVVEVELPPLRDRLEDVLPITETILDRLATDLARPRATLDRSAERALLTHTWPGNVRELENVLTKAFLLARGAAITASDLELAAQAPPSRGPSAALRARITTTLEETDWNVVHASRLLGIPRATLYRKMRRFGLARP